MNEAPVTFAYAPLPPCMILRSMYIYTGLVASVGVDAVKDASQRVSYTTTVPFFVLFLAVTAAGGWVRSLENVNPAQGE